MNRRTLGPSWLNPWLQVPGLLLLLGGFAIGWATKRPAPQPYVDMEILRWFEGVRSPVFNTVGRGVEFWDGPQMTPWLLAAATLGLVMWGRRLLGVLVALMVSLAWLPGHIAKSAFPRERPPASIHPEWTVAGPNSYPSGHTGFVVAATIAGLFVLTALGMRRVWWALLGTALVVVVGWSRMLVGVHYPSDVLGGGILAGGTALVLWPVWAGVLRRSSRRVRPGVDSS